MSCQCHDPVVFGHQSRCVLQLGPVRAGGASGLTGIGRHLQLGQAGQEYEAALREHNARERAAYSRAETVLEWCREYRRRQALE